MVIPAGKAIEEIVLFCEQKWSTRYEHWIRLREGPVLYVKDEPVVSFS